MKEKAKKIFLTNSALYIYGVFFVFVLWWLISLGFGNGNFTFPSPIPVLKTFGELLSRSYIYKGIGMTLARTLIGFAIAFILAFIIGFLSGNFKRLQIVLKPIFIVLKSAPTAAFVFLFLTLFGSDYAPIFIAVLLSFPILYEAFVGGMNNIPKEIEEAMKLDAANKVRGFFKIKLPLSLPYVAVGLASSFALSLKTTIMAEIITGSTNYGLGCAINLYRTSSPGDMTPIFAIALIAIIIILIFDLVSMIIKKKVKIV